MIVEFSTHFIKGEGAWLFWRNGFGFSLLGVMNGLGLSKLGDVLAPCLRKPSLSCWKKFSVLKAGVFWLFSLESPKFLETFGGGVLAYVSKISSSDRYCSIMIAFVYVSSIYPLFANLPPQQLPQKLSAPICQFVYLNYLQSQFLVG